MASRCCSEIFQERQERSVPKRDVFVYSSSRSINPGVGQNHCHTTWNVPGNIPFESTWCVLWPLMTTYDHPTIPWILTHACTVPQVISSHIMATITATASGRVSRCPSPHRCRPADYALRRAALAAEVACHDEGGRVERWNNGWSCFFCSWNWWYKTL